MIKKLLRENIDDKIVVKLNKHYAKKYKNFTVVKIKKEADIFFFLITYPPNTWSASAVREWMNLEEEIFTIYGISVDNIHHVLYRPDIHDILREAVQEKVIDKLKKLYVGTFITTGEHQYYKITDVTPGEKKGQLFFYIKQVLAYTANQGVVLDYMDFFETLDKVFGVTNFMCKREMIKQNFNESVDDKVIEKLKKLYVGKKNLVTGSNDFFKILNVTRREDNEPEMEDEIIFHIKAISGYVAHKKEVIRVIHFMETMENVFDVTNLSFTHVSNLHENTEEKNMEDKIMYSLKRNYIKQFEFFKIIKIIKVRDTYWFYAVSDCQYGADFFKEINALGNLISQVYGVNFDYLVNSSDKFWKD